MLVATTGLPRCLYELFWWLHVLLAAATLAAMCQHLFPPISPISIFFGSGLATWAALKCLNFLYDCYYNINLGRGDWFPKLKIINDYETEDNDQITLQDACHLEIRLHHSWTIEPGQYLFVRVLDLGLLSLLQSHPFWIVWWENDSEQGLVRLDMLVRRRKGFTRRLPYHHDVDYSTWIGRPFGRSEPFGDYGSVIMFATDIGIAAHLPYLKALMEGRSDALIRTRRVLVIWQVKDSSVFCHAGMILISANRFARS